MTNAAGLAFWPKGAMKQFRLVFAAEMAFCHYLIKTTKPGPVWTAILNGLAERDKEILRLTESDDEMSLLTPHVERMLREMGSLRRCIMASPQFAQQREELMGPPWSDAAPHYAMVYTLMSNGVTAQKMETTLPTNGKGPGRPPLIRPIFVDAMEMKLQGAVWAGIAARLCDCGRRGRPDHLELSKRDRQNLVDVSPCITRMKDGVKGVKATLATFQIEIP